MSHARRNARTRRTATTKKVCTPDYSVERWPAFPQRQPGLVFCAPGPTRASVFVSSGVYGFFQVGTSSRPCHHDRIHSPDSRIVRRAVSAGLYCCAVELAPDGNGDPIYITPPQCRAKEACGGAICGAQPALPADDSTCRVKYGVCGNCGQGRAVQVDRFKTRVESAYGFSA